MILTLRAAFEKAKIDASGISKDDFLEQTRLHLLAGKFIGSAFDCVTDQNWKPETYAETREVLHPAADMKRVDIAASNWVELKLYLTDDGAGGAAIWGHERSPEWTRDEQGFDVWGDGWFAGAPVYADVILVAHKFDGLWRAPAVEKPAPWTDDELEAFVRAKEKEIGRKPPVNATWKECSELRRHVKKARFESFCRALYPDVGSGRPFKE